MSVCPCGGLPAGAPFERCCGPAVRNERWPATAEALMRSRYTAFATGIDDHLFRTWHPAHRPADTASDPRVEWTGLTIVRTEAGGEDDAAGTVEFEAHHRGPDGPDVLHENSRFAQRAGRWFYTAPVEDA
ncbi:YchJ family protein [Kocuria marina]|uniref:YchJ family protein n=1 Tax=Kocuria marina TaxID=223184 RepID=UPI0022E0D14D|nr:YchJ family metal-binding protein [Kocuria marina]